MTDNQYGTIGEILSVNKSCEFHGKIGECEFNDRENEVFCEIYWNDKK